MDEEQGPMVVPKSQSIGYWILCCCGSLTGIVCCVAALFVIPKFAAIFKELGLKLPIATRWVFDAHLWGIEYIVILLLLANLFSEHRYGARPWKKGLNIALIPACFIVVGILTIIFLMPLMGGRHKLGPN